MALVLALIASKMKGNTGLIIPRGNSKTTLKGEANEPRIRIMC